MSEPLALRIVADRDRDDRPFPDGTAFQVTFVHAAVYQDAPVLDYARTEVRRKVADAAAEAGHPLLDPAAVTLAEVSPRELDAAWRVNAPMEPPPLPDAYALVGYWMPPGVRALDAVRVSEAALCGCARPDLADDPHRHDYDPAGGCPERVRTCPRCGRDTTTDPTGTRDGDHLIVMQGPLAVSHGLPERATNHVRFAASQDVRLAWCSTVNPNPKETP